jgi:hypothetical protein
MDRVSVLCQVKLREGKGKEKSRNKSEKCKQYLHLCGLIIKFYYEIGVDLSAFFF